MSDTNTRITPVGLGSAAIVGGATGIIAKQSYDHIKTAIKEAKPDSYTAATVKKAGEIKLSVKNFFKNNSIGKFLKHPATLGVAAGIALYVAAKKVFGGNKEYID